MSRYPYLEHPKVQ